LILINENSSVQEFQSSFSIQDTVFSSALACKMVRSANLRREWRKLQPSVMFADKFSD